MKIITTVVFAGLSILCQAQVASVENSVYGIQTGFFGLWVHNESRLTNALTFRSEAGFDTELRAGSFYDKTGFIMTAVLTAEPRYYYNPNKRDLNSKDITHNSGNFLSIKTSFHPDWVVISNYKNVKVFSGLSIIPTWGIRRNIGIHYNFESGFGIGYRFNFAGNSGCYKNTAEVVPNIHLRIGYVF